jgi:hypothetical protein
MTESCFEEQTMKPDLAEKVKQQAEILEKLRANPRVKAIRVAAPQECSMGQSVQGVYDKDNVPELPLKGCSRPGGCICTYEPVLDTIYP